MNAFVPLDFPPWIRWGQRKGAKIHHAKLVAAYPDFRHWSPSIGYVGTVRRCGWCATPCPGRRTSWCSDTCSDKFKRVWSWRDLAAYIGDRDRWRCRLCATTFPGWNQSASLRRVEYVHDVRNWASPRREILERGFRREYFALLEWWEVDHVLPVKDGGTDHPANLRLLCHGCHVERGRQWRRIVTLGRAARIAESANLRNSANGVIVAPIPMSR